MTLRLSSVTRRFGDVVALNRVDLEVPVGITALVGPNGAGKSTVMKVATGHVRPTAGRVLVMGAPVWDNPEILRQLGYVPEQDAFYEDLPALEFVARLAEIGGMSEGEAKRNAQDALEGLGMGDALDRPLKACSKGMRQRVKLAQALVHRPKVLLLDEPMLGCDPIARRRIHDRVRGLANEGCAILVSSHILPEMEQLTRDIAILHGGRLVARGRASQVRAALSQIPSRIRIHTGAPRAVAADVASWENVGGVRIERDYVDLETPRMREVLERLQTSSPSGWKLKGHEVMDADLDTLLRYVTEATA